MIIIIIIIIIILIINQTIILKYKILSFILFSGHFVSDLVCSILGPRRSFSELCYLFVGQLFS